MTGPRDSARGNGLMAGAWTVLGDVDPRVVPWLLASLAEQGIAAFALPSHGSRGGYLDVHLPLRPLDEVHVDAARKDEALTVLHGVVPPAPAPAANAGASPSLDPHEADSYRRDLPEAPLPPAPGDLDPDAVDAAFASIVARFDEPGADDRGLPDGPAVRTRTPAPGPARMPAPGSVPEDEHYLPPVPPPVPRPAAATAAGLGAVLIGIALLVWTAASGTATQDLQLAGILLLVGGVALLVSRLRPSPDEGDDPDDGAVV